MRQHNNEGLTTSKVVLAVVGVAFVVELAIMAGLQKFGTPTDPGAALLNAALLAILLAAPVYWLVQRPLRSQYAKRREAERFGADMTQLALTDTLTRIPNRRGITAALLDAMAQADRYNTPLSVAMGDIDHFKRINDTHGHEAGDKVLAQLAAIMSESLRMPDKVGRYGGEEFLIVFPHTTLAQARKIAERIRAAVADAAFDLNGKRAQVTLSIGVTQFQRGEDLEQLLVRVDKALYQAKAGGRNLVAAEKASRRRGE
ncbi:MAG TPA: GGDEF domain-containing protein [Burkholderiales bacterium]